MRIEPLSRIKWESVDKWVLLHSKCWVSIDGDNDTKKYFCKIRNNDYEKIPNRRHNYEKILGKWEDLM